MVTIQDAVQYVNGVACTTQKVWCKSTDVKPTEGIGNGSQLREMDTGKDYAFDAESGEWLEQPSEGGGGGGGGGGSSTLSGLTDVDISNPSNGQTLVYNSTSGKWENGVGTLIVHKSFNMDTSITVLDTTFAEIYDAVAAGRYVIIAAFTHEDDTYYEISDIELVAAIGVDGDPFLTTYSGMNLQRYTYRVATVNSYPERGGNV